LKYDAAKNTKGSYDLAIREIRRKHESRKMRDDYLKFLEGKAPAVTQRGLTKTPDLASHLFSFQKHCVDFNLRCGPSGLFLDTGLGKTECQLEYSKHALEATNGRALILTPLAVAGQTKRRAERWGYDARVIRDMSEVKGGINICNYDRLEKLDTEAFGSVVLDEASILKSFTGKTTRSLCAAFRSQRFKLVATATPAPNDNTELGNYCDFLSIMHMNEMLSRFFINDASTASHEWRLKGHAIVPFWDWMSSWARMAEKPSDLGDSDDGFILPPFKVIRHRARNSDIVHALMDMFGAVTMSATSMHDVKRQTSKARAETAASLIASEPNETWIIWCDTDYEADALRATIPNAVEIRGSQTMEVKEERLAAFASGEIKILIGKPSQLGMGLDWSHCARMAFVGRSYSYELWYQAVRRAWRFGQKRELMVHLIVAEGETEIGRVVDQKSDGHAKMKTAMRDAMARAVGKEQITKTPYNPKHMEPLPSWITSAA